MTPTLARAIVTLDSWQYTARPYRPAEMKLTLEIDRRTLARALRLLGWQRHQHFVRHGSRRTIDTWWTPPGVREPIRRRRGRPSYYELVAV